MINILVLGVGGNVSQGILKAINLSGIECRVLGACVTPDAVGFYWCDTSYISPYANEENFIPWLVDICNKERIDLVLTGVEENIFEIQKSINALKEKTNAKFIFSDTDKLEIGKDKLKTCVWLKENNCNYPEYCESKNLDKAKKLAEKTGFPLIAKPRNGKGSQGLVKVNNYSELKDICLHENYVIQECIGNENTEYTVGCYCDKNGNIKEIIIMHRYLKDGTTWKAEVVENYKIRDQAIKICKAFKPSGPLNIQLRINEKGEPVTFELNVRFSGTTPMRAHFGYNDVKAMIKEYVLNENIDDCFNIKKGTAYRYTNEMYVFGNHSSDAAIPDKNSINVYTDSFLGGS